MRLIIWDYSYLAFLFCQLYTQGCHARVCNVPCYSSGWRGFQICCCFLCHWPHKSYALNHLRNRKLKDGLSSTINMTDHLINMEPQAGFGFNGPKIQVCWEQGFGVYFLRGFASLFLLLFYVLIGDSDVWVRWVDGASRNSVLWFLVPTTPVNWQSAFCLSGTM